MPAVALQAADLRRRCDPTQLGFETTREVAPLEGTIGQPRALEALEYGLGVGAPGHHIFVTGSAGTGRRGAVETQLRARAAARDTPRDLVHVHNFADPRRPLAVALPAGTAPRLASDAADLVEEARRRIREAFESERYATRRKQVLAELERQGEEVLGELREEARKRDLSLEMTPAGIVTLPMVQGQPVPPQQFGRLPAPVQEAFRERISEIESRLPAAMRRMRELERESRKRVRALDREVAQFAAGHIVEELKHRWRDVPEVVRWLDAALEDMIDNLPRLQAADTVPPGVPPAVAEEMRRAQRAFAGRYEVNVLVTHDPEQGAPVVLAPTATFQDLFGRIEHKSAFGALETDHRFVRAGALHRANGGYLVLDAANVLTQPFVWTKLKETLRTRRARIENVAAQYVVFPAATLEPQEVELDVKVVLIGSPELYRLLYMLDEDVRKLFRVRADFDVEVPWDDGHVAQYAAFVSRCVRELGLRHFASDAVARVIEHGARANGHKQRLSTRFVDVEDLIVEADHCAGQASSDLVRADHVDAALERRRRRSNLVEEKVHRAVSEGTLLVDVDGSRVGAVNGLAVTGLGDHEFGHPVRVTAMVSVGGGELVNIDRETKLGGPIYAKGFLILAGFLRDRYGSDAPLAVRASIVMEQSYGGVEGDSAAAAELIALLSSLSGVPVRQDVAVTGSVNQHGEIQPVGGVDAKIEGFFAACRDRGLTGEQGVLVPAANVPNLMLHREVVAAVDAGDFHVWAVDTIDSGVELLTGMPAGERRPDGSYPPDTVNRRIADRLADFARIARQQRDGRDGRDGPDGDSDGQDASRAGA